MHNNIVSRARAELAALTRTDRLRQRTADRIRARLDERMLARLRRETAADPRRLTRRMKELDQQWNIERILEGTAAAAVLTGVGLGATVDRRFLVLPAVVLLLWLQQAAAGWCPPAAVLRRFGLHTRREIETERQALEQLRAATASV
ncbi:MAG TPA: hypothetical protein VFS33_05940 [Gemmatimonadales bacterium]|nr:hypothetical protein [Gemmatimonadales bacterium]